MGQAWFWTDEWQAKEREADEDIAAGRTIRYESDEVPSIQGRRAEFDHRSAPRPVRLGA